MSPPAPEPRNLPPLRPDSFLTVQPPIPDPQHPVFLYLGSLPSEASERAMRAALERVAALFGLGLHQLKWWALPARNVWSIRRRLTRKGYSAASVNQSLSAIRGVLGVAHDRGLIGTAVYEADLAVPMLKIAPTDRAAPSARRVQRLLETTRADRSPEGAARRGDRGDDRACRPEALGAHLAPPGRRRPGEGDAALAIGSFRVGRWALEEAPGTRGSGVQIKRYRDGSQ